MSRRSQTLLVILVFAMLPAFAQEADSYERFRASYFAATSKFTESDLEKLQSDYPEFIGFGVRSLERLKTEPGYAEATRQLLSSPEPAQRWLAYAVIASANDQDRIPDLREAVQKDNKLRVVAGLALLLLKDERTDELLDFVVAYDELHDPHLFAAYLENDPNRIRDTALRKLRSANHRTRILAMSSLSVTELNPDSEGAIRLAIDEWPPEDRVYAIHTAKELGMPALRELLAPSLQLPLLRPVALTALAHSPTLDDQACLEAQIPSTGVVPEDVLDALLDSTRTETVKRWLQLIRKRPAPSEYYLGADHPLLRSDELLPDLLQTLKTTPNHDLLDELVRFLKGRQDQESVGLRLQLLQNPDETLRYWTADSLKSCHDSRLVKLLPSLLRDEKRRTVPLVWLALENQVNGLQDAIKPMLTDEDWQLSALEYLATFPRPEDRETFRAILQGDESGSLKRYAARGLGVLQDASSLDLILAALAHDAKHEALVLDYLRTLATFRDERARQAIASYAGSANPRIRDLVRDILTHY